MKTISVVLIEDHDLTRMGLRTALQQQDNINLLGEAANGNEGLKLLTQLQPDLAIVDIGLPDLDGIELTQKFKQSCPEEIKTKILILTMHDDELEVLSAFAAGADSYCIKNIHIQQLIEAIKTTTEGQSWIDPAIAEIVLQQVRQSNSESIKQETVSIKALSSEEGEILRAYPLTERELDVLELIVGGYSNSKIGEKLHISLGTVKTHVRNILDKLSASDRTEAAVRALRAGLVK
ncbi:MAG: response regulator transcription factor [Xenococcaceae cyanobacterium MO_188.B32]|nr:response regulator transcription factor [Xenococcaceae cyanobacterium MO_188.B32]